MAKPVFVPLAAGVQTELAAQLVQPGATLLMENCTSEQTGKTRVRLGSDLLSTASQTTIPAGGTLPVPWQLATLEGMLVRFNRAPIPLHTWARPAAAWTVPTNDGGLESLRRGPIKLDTTPVFSGTAQVADPTVAVGTDSIVCVNRLTGDSLNGFQVSILDRLSRRPVFTKKGLSPGGTSSPRVVILGSRAVVAYEAGGSLTVDSYNLTTFALAQTVTLGAATSGTPIDMRIGSPVAGANNVAILYRDNAGVLKCATVDATNLATNSTFGPRSSGGTDISPDLAFGWLQDFGGSGKFSIMTAWTVNGLRVYWDFPAPAGGFSNATANHVLDAGATAVPSGVTAGVRNVIGTTIDNTATGHYRVLYEVTAPSIRTWATIKIAVWDGAAHLGTQYKSVGIRSKFWRASAPADNYYFLAAFQDTDQESYFVLAMSNDTVVSTTTFPAPLAVALPRDAGGLTEGVSMPSDAPIDADGSIFIGVTEQTLTELAATAGGTATGAATRLFGVDLVRVRHPSTAETEFGKPVEFIKTLFTPGGMPGQFDGQTFDAISFPYYPPVANSGAAAQAGGTLAATANYFYRFVYAKIDRNGRIWRSSPSAVISGTTTGVNKQFLVTMETLRLFDRALASGVVAHWIEVYRSQANAPAAFFQVAVIPNDPTNDTISFTDNVADVNIGEELYTDGGGVENQLLPSMSNWIEYQGRLVGLQAGTGTLWYSVEADFDHGLIFNEALTLDVADPNDPGTGLAVFNETLFVMKAGKVYIIAGEGADALGRGATYTPRLIDGSVGCSNPQSIAVADDGVWFRSSATRAGIHRTTGGPADYVGGGVHAYDGLTITSAVVVRDKTEIRFYTLEGTTLVWNWTTKIWGVNTGQPCLSAIVGYSGVPGGVIYVRASDAAVLSEATASSPAPYKEGGAAGAFYTAKVRSPWYQGGGLAGWERIRRIQGVGEAGAAHTAMVRLYKNLSATPFQAHSLAFAGNEERWTWEVRPAMQKSSATLIEVEILRPPAITVAPDAINDAYNGAGAWHFGSAPFVAGHVGGTVTLTGTAGGNYNGTFAITQVVGASDVIMSPTPAGGPGAITAATITLTPAPTAGPGIVGVSLLPAAKEGMDKLPAARRLTSLVPFVLWLGAAAAVTAVLW